MAELSKLRSGYRLSWRRRFRSHSWCYSLQLPWWRRRERVCLQCRGPRFNPWVRKIPWRREWQLTSVFLPGEFHGQKSLLGYSPGVTKSHTTEQLTLSLTSNIQTITNTDWNRNTVSSWWHHWNQPGWRELIPWSSFSPLRDCLLVTSHKADPTRKHNISLLEPGE